MSIALAPDAVRAQTEAPETSLLLILDASGSMRAELGRTTRIAAARRALRRLVSDLPSNSRVGLRVYGHRVSGNQARGCRDTQLVVPVREVDRRHLRQRIASFRPRGFTPIGLSLTRAMTDLPRRGERNVVLVSDGIDTCSPPPPCKVARRLGRGGVRVDVVGLSVAGRARNQLRCIARAGNGRYLDARSAPQLADRLYRIALGAFRPFEASGTPVEGGTNASASVSLEPGQYADQIGSKVDRWYSVEVAPNQSLSVSATLVGDPRGSTSRFGMFAVRVYTPELRSPLSGRAVSDFDGRSPATVAAQTGPVGLTTSADDWRAAGNYYVRLTLDDVDELRGSAFPVELTTTLEGEPRPPVARDRLIPAEEPRSRWPAVAALIGALGIAIGWAITAGIRTVID